MRVGRGIVGGGRRGMVCGFWGEGCVCMWGGVGLGVMWVGGWLQKIDVKERV